MIIFIDQDFRCHTESADELTAVETNAFDGKCRAFIEGCRFVPEGCEWTRSDGVVFIGEMVAPWEDSRILSAAQAQYEEMLPEMQDMQSALELLGAEPTEV